MRTEKQETFIEQYCLTGKAARAAEMAGYSHAKQRGYELKNKFAKEIEDCVPGALAQLNELAQNAESESVRLGAVKDVLDRAGLKPTEKIRQEISHVEQSSTDELQRELEALIGTSDISEIPELVN